MKRLNSLMMLVLLASTLNWLSPMQAAHASAADTDLALTMSTASNQYAYLASNSSNNSFTSLTLEAWVRPTVYASSFGVIGKEVAYTLYSQGGYWYYALANSSGSWAGIYTALPVKLNEWHHIALTRAAGQNVANFYIDGLLVFSSTADGAGIGSIGANSYALYIGDRSGQTNGSVDTNWLFPGQIDEVRIWKSSRTQTQIVSDMNNFGPTSDSNLVYYFSFNNGTGANDSTSGAGDLTLMNSPTFTDIKSVDTSTSPGYAIVKFPRTYLTSLGGWVAPIGVTRVTAVVVGGGGGGTSQTDKTGWVGGGGGAGGYQNTTVNVSPGTFYSVVVGQGGLGGRTIWVTDTALGQAGGATTFASTTSLGGGYGGGQSANSVQNGANGASGGGGGTYSGTGGTGTSGQGNNGGASGSTCCSSGGGGGSASVGGDGSGSTGGIGGNGTANPFFASPAYLAAGGNGLGGSGSSYSSQTGGTAGQASTAATPATNTGSGGGGGGGGSSFIAAGNGASGIVMIKYKNQFATSISISVNAKKTTKNSASTPITAVTTSSGTVTFYANGRVINGCNGVAVSGTTATCNWRPMTHGQVTLTATYTSTDPLYSGSAAAPAYVTTVGKRTTAR